MIDVTIEAPMAPRGKGRPRAAMTETGMRVFTPAATRQWEAKLALLAQDAMPAQIIDEPLVVEVSAVFQRTQAQLGKKVPAGLMWMAKRPDIDNVVKIVLDALRPFWRDDSLVVDLRVRKLVSEADGRPRVIVRIRSVWEEFPHLLGAKTIS